MRLLTSRNLSAILSLLMLIGAGCAPDAPARTPAPSLPPNPTAPASTPAPTQTSAPASAPETAPAPIRTASPTVDPASPRVNGLSPEGPWLLVRADASLWGVNPDGAGLSELVPGAVMAPVRLDEALSPTGRHVAYVTSQTLDYRGLTLHIDRLPDLRSELVLPLQSAATEPGPETGPGEPRFEIGRAIVEVSNLAWSPDGDRLAFTGAHQGESADLYVHDLTSGETTRLTDGPSQAIQPIWTPDGRAIVHAGVSSLGTGAGYGLMGVWLAPADGAPVQEVYAPEGSGGEIWVGWSDPDTLVVYSFSAVCGFENLRTVDVRSGEPRVLWSSAFADLAFDPAGGHVLLAIEALGAPCDLAGVRGLLLTHPEAQDGLPLAEIDVSELRWAPPVGRFLALTSEGLWAVSPEGEISEWPSPASALPILSPNGERAAFAATALQTAPGLWVGPTGGPFEQVSEDPAALVQWSPSGDVLWFAGEDGLYRAAGPDFQPELVGKDLPVTSLAWATP